MVARLNEVRFLALQFRFTNRSLLPRCVRYIPWETKAETQDRQERAAGELYLPSTPAVELSEFMAGLEDAGYAVVDACYQPRVGQGGKNQVHVVRYTFRRPGEDTHEPHCPLERQKEMEEELRNLCVTNLWDTQAYLNPFQSAGGVLIPNLWHFSINMTAPQPLYVNGKREMRWERDADGRKIGTAPVPLKASHYLVVEESVVTLLTPGT